MKKIILMVGAITMLLYACGGGQETTTTEQAVTEVATPDGEKLYQANCVSCHGAFGKPMIAGAKDLTDATILLERRIEVITNGSTANPMMISWKSQLSEAEIKAVAEYTMTFVEE